MRAAYLKGPLLLLVMQTAPIDVTADSAGRLRLSLGFGAGQFEDRTLNCAGEVTDAWPIEFSTGGAVLEYWVPAAPFRLSAFGGVAWLPGGSDAWGGAQIALETRYVGLGGGVVQNPWVGWSTYEVPGWFPSLYTRFGNLNGVHLRGDMFYPNPALGTTGDLLRLGIAGNQGLRPGMRWYVGASATPYSDAAHGGGVFGEFHVPVTRGLEANFAASWHSSDRYADYGVRAGLRYGFGR